MQMHFFSSVSGDEPPRAADSSEAELTFRSSQPGPALPIGIAMELDIRELKQMQIFSPQTHKTSPFFQPLSHIQENQTCSIWQKSKSRSLLFSSLEHTHSDEIHFTQLFASVSFRDWTLKRHTARIVWAMWRTRNKQCQLMNKRSISLQLVSKWSWAV